MEVPRLCREVWPTHTLVVTATGAAETETGNYVTLLGQWDLPCSEHVEEVKEQARVKPNRYAVHGIRKAT
ncbi:hypothetical protein RvY_09189 [Ramazzottius varieornatus]|uniref:Uncharacterized protein n=1 Tax=Ramazzottius varieornatus TaxID=947166 RepID=A0A1D1VE14_RAMVA|nr:hypothetical protein RvY_09189 [Ramazzottius varieornatus]